MDPFFNENSHICNIVRAHLTKVGKTLKEFRDTVPRRSSLANEIEGLRNLGYHKSSEKVAKVNAAVRALKNFVPSTRVPTPKRTMSSAKRSRPAGYAYPSESPAKSHPGPTFSHGQGHNSGSTSTPNGYAARQAAKAKAAMKGAPSGTAPSPGLKFNPNMPGGLFGQQPPFTSPTGSTGFAPSAGDAAFATAAAAAAACDPNVQYGQSPYNHIPSTVSGSYYPNEMESLADSVSQMTTATYQVPAACKHAPKSADELLKEVPTDPQSLSSRMVNDELAAKTSISDAVGASTNDVKLLITVIDQAGIAKVYFDSLEAVAGKEQALVNKAETKLDEELAVVAQEEKEENVAIEKAKADLKLRYEADLKQIEADGQVSIKHIHSKKGVIEEVRDTLLKSSGQAQTRLKARIKIGRQGIATLTMATTSSNANEPELKANRDRLVDMQRAWKQAQDSGDDGILKEEILGKDLDKDRMQV